jgi:N-acyl-D-amino-acid deacylase
MVSIASDSGLNVMGEGVPHPRGYGNTARALGRYVRERRVVSLEEAVRKMTSLPADHFGFRNRGRLASGAAADVVIFDAARVADRATYEQPHQYPDGISTVIVNGAIVLQNGIRTDARPGQVLRRR